MVWLYSLFVQGGNKTGLFRLHVHLQSMYEVCLRRRPRIEIPRKKIIRESGFSLHCCMV